MTTAILDYLEKNKFQSEGFFKRLKIKHKFLQNLEVCIVNDLIIVFANNIEGSREDIYCSELTLKDLKEVLTWLRK